MSDLISRQAAINAICTEGTRLEHNGTVAMVEIKQWCVNILEELPSAQSEIIRCKDCKYRDENFRRVYVGWLPCMDSLTGSNWFCGSAERRTNE
jgi:hypothetical protein